MFFTGEAKLSQSPYSFNAFLGRRVEPFVIGGLGPSFSNNSDPLFFMLRSAKHASIINTYAYLENTRLAGVRVVESTKRPDALQAPGHFFYEEIAPWLTRPW